MRHSLCTDNKAQSNIPESSVVFYLCHFAAAQGTVQVRLLAQV